MTSTPDVAAVLARRHENGADYWAGPGGKIYVGNPFSTLSCLGLLHELGVDADHEAVSGALDLVLAACRDDGRVRVGPTTPMYPCYTAEAARMLCRFGLAEHPAVRRTVRYLRDSAHEDGGWRCSFSRFGSGPETVHSNPGATLYVLDVLRHYPEFCDGSDEAANAVASLLDHWSERAPRGPCHWGIGTQFMRVEYPFWRYNLFFWVYVLSFFAAARRDGRFHHALAELSDRLDDDGRVVVEHRHRKLKGLAFCARGQPSHAATARMNEILARTAET